MQNNKNRILEECVRDIKCCHVCVWSIRRYQHGWVGDFIKERHHHGTKAPLSVFLLIVLALLIVVVLCHNLHR